MSQPDDIDFSVIQAAIWKGQAVEIVDIGKDHDGVPHALLRMVDYGNGNQGSWVPAYRSMDSDYAPCGDMARELLKAARRIRR